MGYAAEGGWEHERGEKKTSGLFDEAREAGRRLCGCDEVRQTP